MKWVAIAMQIVGGLCLLAVLLGALRTVLEKPHFIFVRKFEESTRYSYIGLTVLGVALLIVGFFPDLQLRSVDVLGLKAEVGKLDTKVETLSQQMEAFFKQRKSEIFDVKHNWDRVRILSRTKTPQSVDFWDYRLAITLEQEPIEGSVDIWLGINPMPNFKLDGKVVTFEVTWSETPDAPFGTYENIRVTYYPRAATAAGK